MVKALKLALMATSALLLVNQAQAGPIPPGADPANNNPPPSGPVILNLNGTPVPHTYTAYSVNFVATSATTNLSFAMREDPSFLQLDDVSMVNHTTGSPTNLVLNGNFALGTIGSPAPTNWTYLNTFGASFGGVLTGGCGVTAGTNCYEDGAVQAYDSITQPIATIVGDTYTVSFELNDIGSLTTFSQLSTNGQPGTGGNGIDLVVYAGAIPTLATTPEPTSLVLLGSGLLGFGFLRRWRKRV